MRKCVHGIAFVGAFFCFVGVLGGFVVLLDDMYRFVLRIPEFYTLLRNQSVFAQFFFLVLLGLFILTCAMILSIVLDRRADDWKWAYH